MIAPLYQARRAARSQFVVLRGLRHHLLVWGNASLVTPERPPLVLLHGWMDVAASFQFMVDALQAERYIVALDWRGFGLTDNSGSDSYWYPDYLGDLDALLDHSDLGLATQPIDLLGHSMGANAVMLYAGVRPERIRRLINLEGFGMPATTPEKAPSRYREWLDELKAPMQLRAYDTLAEVAARLRKTNPLLPEDKAAWLAPHWARQAEDGRWHLLADPAHKRVSPVLYHVDEALACWRLIAAPLLWVEGDRTDTEKWWGHRYPRSEFEARLAVVPRVERQQLSPAGHMLHHDQPVALARRMEEFLR